MFFLTIPVKDAVIGIVHISVITGDEWFNNVGVQEIRKVTVNTVMNTETVRSISGFYIYKNINILNIYYIYTHKVKSYVLQM